MSYSLLQVEAAPKGARGNRKMRHRGQKMMTKKADKKSLLVAALFFAFCASSALAFDPGDRVVSLDPSMMEMEASAVCADGFCLDRGVQSSTQANLQDLGDVSNNLKKVGVFSPDGRDPRKKLGYIGDYPIIQMIVERDFMVDGKRETLSVLGTGFMVSPCLALTARHVAKVELSSDYMYDNKIARLPTGHPDKLKTHIKAIVSRNSNDQVSGEIVKIGHFAGGEQGDWALIRLPSCPGITRNLGWLKVDPVAEDELPKNVATMGFYSDLYLKNKKDQTAIWGQSGCNNVHRVTLINNDHFFEHYCTSLPMHSGAPVLRSTKNGPAVFAINIGAHTNDTRVQTEEIVNYGNRAADIRRFWPEIKDDIEQSLAQYKNYENPFLAKLKARDPNYRNTSGNEKQKAKNNKSKP